MAVALHSIPTSGGSVDVASPNEAQPPRSGDGAAVGGEGSVNSGRTERLVSTCGAAYFMTVVVAALDLVLHGSSELVGSL